jgi:CubicO group peptidase (beta-lactamase class C family)
LRLRPRDLARIGKLVLANGSWRSRQIVPQDWLEESFKTRFALLDGMEYGYQWWLGGGKQEGDERVIVARGNGGQRLVIVPALELAAALLCGNYNRPDQALLPGTVMREYIAGALRS